MRGKLRAWMLPYYSFSEGKITYYIGRFCEWQNDTRSCIFHLNNDCAGQLQNVSLLEGLVAMQRIFLDKVDSTMSVMERLMSQQRLEEGSVVVAAGQYQGRGMENNSWESEHDANLLATFVLYPHFLHPSLQFHLNCAVSLAVYEAVNAQLPDVRVSIKWPNDVYVEGKKVAGLLIRHQICGELLDVTYAGIGLNINQVCFRSDAPNPVSLRQVDGRTRNPGVLLDQLQQILMKWYDRLRSGHGSDLRDAYHACMYRRGVQAGYLIHGRQVQATILGIDEYGLLMVREASGKVTHCDLKEIVYLIS